MQVTGVDELEAGDPVAVARENARRKHDAALRTAPAGALVLAVDTVVALGDRIYGKPADAAHARATLDALAGAEHRVVSGFVLGGVVAGSHCGGRTTARRGYWVERVQHRHGPPHLGATESNVRPDRCAAWKTVFATPESRW